MEVNIRIRPEVVFTLISRQHVTRAGLGEYTVWNPQAYPDVRWFKRSLSQAVTVGRLRAEFCCSYQISTSECLLRQNGKLISSDQALQEVSARPKTQLQPTASLCWPAP